MPIIRYYCRLGLIRFSALMILSFAYLFAAHAQTDTARVYNEEHPLVYEDSWDLWPYSFLNDNGQPDGYNVDLIRMIMKELNIPVIIKLKPAQDAFNDLKDGKSDLMLGLAVGFHDEYGLYSQNAVTLFTQSVVTPKNKAVEIKTFRDLGKDGLKVIVNDSSLCHHLMIDYGWADNAIPSKDIREAIQMVSAKEEGQIVWNTLSLKWLLNRYHIENLELTPVNMPHGEYKFMSNSQKLLDMLDEAYSRLYTADKINTLQDKWFYPERLKSETPEWIWYAAAIAVILILLLAVYGISYKVQNSRLTRENTKQNRRLALILQTSHVRIWTYDILKNQFSWRNDNGQVAYTYSMDEFSQRYSQEDFKRLKDALNRLSQQEKSDVEEEVPLSLRAKDVEGGDTDDRDYYIVLSVLSRDKQGKPTVIIGTKKDVTVEQRQKRLDDERTLRYWSIFYTPMVSIMLFDKNGILININPKACEMFECEDDEIISENVSIYDLLSLGDIELKDLDGFYASQRVNIDNIPFTERKIKSIHRRGKLCNEYQLMTVYDDSGDLLGIFAIFRDITESVYGIEQNAQETARLEAIKAVLSEYNTNIDRVINESDVRMATYSPKSHTLTIYRSVSEVQHALTQTRCMTLVDDYSKKLAMRILNDMDGCTDNSFKVNIRTTLRIKGRKRLELLFCLMPVHDKKGNVIEYLGLLRDISGLRDTEKKLELETAKVQEVEQTKNTFVKNMVQEIRTPMSTVLEYVAQINDNAPSPDEKELSKGILENADYLLHLIDNVLYLSRLQAKMVEIQKQPCDFPDRFEAQCWDGWSRYMNENTKYVVENPYEQLIVDIDADNLCLAIDQVCANAAQHTKSGVIRARYDYIGRRLVISVDDTGEGIPKEELLKLNNMDARNAQTTKGLGLAITKELVSQMGGTVEISSEEGSGTTVYITIPCHATEIKRKKLV